MFPSHDPNTLATALEIAPSKDVTFNGDLAISKDVPALDFVDTNSDDDFRLRNNNGTFEIFDTTNSNTTLSITSSGALLVNTTSALGGIHTIEGDQSNGGSSALTVYNSNSSDTSPALNVTKNSTTTSSSARFMQFYADDGTVPMGGIVGNGASNVQFATISDIREK